MNILILNGSPRANGNTRGALQKMEEILQKDHTVELLNVCTMNLSGCLACDGCKRNGGHCVRPDQSDSVIQKIKNADAVVFGTPVYWWGMSAQLKMVVDKFYSQDPQFKQTPKNIAVVAVGANGLENVQYRLIHEQFACIADHLNWQVKAALSFAAYEPGELMAHPETEPQLQKACEQLTQK